MSRRSLSFLVAAVILAIPFAVLAHDDEHHPASAAPGEHHPGKPVAMKGEVLDLACYIGHGAKGPDHTACARMCAKQGQPTGFLTDDGAVYVIFASHDDPSVLEKVKELAGKKVEVKGEVFTQSGLKGIQVAEIKGI